MRVSPIPLIVVLVLVGLVYLLPQRGEERAAAELPRLSVLDVTEPPAWAQSRGTDEIARNLDRIAWGNHDAMIAARRALRPHAGTLKDDVLSRLRALGETDPVQTSKLLALLSDEDDGSDEVFEMLEAKVRSQSSLVTMAALRVLAYSPHPGSVYAMYPRLSDVDPDVQRVARSALGIRAAGGDVSAQQLILEELEAQGDVPDLEYLSTLRNFRESPEAAELLLAATESGALETSLMAWSALLDLGHPAAIEHFDEALASDDHVTQLNSLRVVASSGRLVGEDSWADLARSGVRPVVLTTASLLVRSIDTGHESAGEALALLEELAADSLCPAQVEIITALYQRDHDWAVEKTRKEIKTFVGGQLSQTVDRLIASPGAPASAQMIDLAFERLEGSEPREIERALLCRLVAHVAPTRAAERLVGYALQDDGVSPQFANEMVGLLDRLGEPGLVALGERADESERAASLFVYLAGALRSPQALPYLEQIVLDDTRDLRLRRDAMDAIVRVDVGPREEVLRRAADALPAGPLRDRARLLFWNYL